VLTAVLENIQASAGWWWIQRNEAPEDQ